MTTEERSAWLAAWAAILCTFLTIAVQIGNYFLAARDKHHEDLLEHRREALISALEVIDHVYANVSFSGQPPSNPHKWDVSTARQAMNRMIIYCKDPNRAVAAFSKAAGMRNLDAQPQQIPFGPKNLAEFRDVICDELELPSIKYKDTNMVWIYSLPGAN
jgi:hypothetical protein